MRALAIIGGLTAVALLVHPALLMVLAVPVFGWAVLGLRATLRQGGGA